MNFSDMITTLSQQTEMVKPELFPFPFKSHLIFCCIGFIFLAYRFYTQRRPHQIIMAFALPISLMVWLSEKKSVYYTMGIIELVLIVAAIAATVVYNVHNSKKKNGKDAAEEASDENGAAEENDADENEDSSDDESGKEE
ncbi:MAG: hypothetical protein NC485_04695 [Ruminococcus flavefaciens]|nr:hypothetical protein [Ruminococcus flavefaciens]MCM1058850.1 hypothetical protein [Eubacterium sp.]